MFSFDQNSETPRRIQFWTRVAQHLPLSYAFSSFSLTLMYQFGVVTDHTVASTNLLMVYFQLGFIGLAGGLTTAARTFRPDFNTWWSESPQYQPIRLPETNLFSEDDDSYGSGNYRVPI